ncbi:MAG: hypothetical protein V1663_03540 [archaeon]
MKPIKIKIKTKYIIYLLLILLIVPFAYSVQCTKAGFCQGQYNLSCSYVSDQKCPEYYGDWLSAGCQNNNYPGTYNRCFPCDPDCNPDCGNLTALIDSNLPPSSFALIQVELFTVSISQFYVNFSQQIGMSFIQLGAIQCQDSIAPINPNDCTCIPVTGGKICTLNYTAYTSSFGGTRYSYKVYMQASLDTVFVSGVTKPYVNVLDPDENHIYIGDVPIKVNASSRYTTQPGIQEPDEEENPGSGGTGLEGDLILRITGMAGEDPPEDIGFTNITSLNITLYKNTGNATSPYYQPADPTSNCAWCNTIIEPNCNLLATWSPTQATPGFNRNNNIFTYTWNSINCGGDYKAFRITAAARDANSNNYDEASNVTLNNQGAPCMDNCPKVSTSILNLVISKIKVWL